MTWSNARGAYCVALGAGAWSAGCTEAPARPQVVVVLDTNAPAADQASGDRTLSGDASLDTLRIEVLDTDVEPRELFVGNPLDWPVSFGLVLEPKETALVRVRAFRASVARSLGGDEPAPEATIERLIELTGPDEGVRLAGVLLDAACFGRRATFTEPPATCIGEGALVGAPSDGVRELTVEPPTSSTLGQWPSAREHGCQASPVAGRTCVPGGYSLLGDPLLVDVQNGVLRAAPMQPAVIRPFWVDTSELTIGRFLLLAPLLTTPLPLTKANDSSCTWDGSERPANPELPLSCVEWETARELCELDGGRLPTEAQWEHMARGRGDRRPFPWGDTPPECCSATFQQDLCPGAGPVASGPSSLTGCPAEDVSRDGVRDLAGNLTEHTRDKAVPFGGPSCWNTAGVSHDPECGTDEVVLHTLRGGNWDSGVFALQGAVRIGGQLAAANVGFRCVYEDAP